MDTSPGHELRQALSQEKPLQMLGVINAYIALMAKQTGFHALYLSGAGVANASYALPDLGITSLENLLEDANRILSAVDLPLLVDIDAGGGTPWSIARHIKSLTRIGAAGVHMEDQVIHKRCGHRPGKKLVSTEEMVNRIKIALDAKTDPHFVIMARTDAFAVEGFEKAIERALAYQEAGADMLFPEGLSSLEEFRLFKETLTIPILANMTEFGMTPLLTTQELLEANIDIVLYPLSVARAMNQAALQTMKEIRHKGTQKEILPLMQTREELYHILGYEALERKLDHLLIETKEPL